MAEYKTPIHGKGANHRRYKSAAWRGVIVAQALCLLLSATDTVALQSRIAHNLCVSEFQFGGDSSMLFV
jgi:hypothetical protein